MPMSTHSLMPCSKGSSMPSPTRQAAGLAGAPVGRLHHARAAAGDHRVAGLGQRRAQVARPSSYSGLSGWRAGRAEDADRRRQLGERAEALDELGLDPQHPPGVGVHPVASGRGESSSRWSVVPGLDLVAAQRHRAAVPLGRRWSRRASPVGWVRRRAGRVGMIVGHAGDATRTVRRHAESAAESPWRAPPGHRPLLGRDADHRSLPAAAGERPRAAPRADRSRPRWPAGGEFARAGLTAVVVRVAGQRRNAPRRRTPAGEDVAAHGRRCAATAERRAGVARARPARCRSRPR